MLNPKFQEEVRQDFINALMPYITEAMNKNYVMTYCFVSEGLPKDLTVYFTDIDFWCRLKSCIHNYCKDIGVLDIHLGCFPIWITPTPDEEYVWVSL